MMPWDYADQSFEAVPACPVCGRSNKSWRAVDRYDLLISLSACGRCGLIYLNPRMTRESYAGFYREAYRDLVKAWEVALHKHYDMEAINEKRGIELGGFLRSQCRSPKRILDVGGGTGALTKPAAKALDCEDVTVIDPCADELAQAAMRGCYIHQGLIETMPPSMIQYDLIICAQTADHWVAPMEALRWLRGALAPGGALWIDILDSFAVAQLQPLTHWKIDHPMYWSRKSFPGALTRAGWRIRSTASQPGQIAGQHIGYLCQ